MSTIQTLARWIDDNGYRSVGFNREFYIDYGCGDDPAAWVTELQEPIVPFGGDTEGGNPVRWRRGRGNQDSAYKGGAQAGPPVEPILTGRLVLEPLRVEYAEEMQAVLAAPELYTFIGGTPPTLADLRARYRQMVAGPPDGRPVGWLNWVIRQQRDQRLTGTVQATIWPEPGDAAGTTFLRASVAWVVGARWQRCGIATEAALALIAWLREHGVTAIMATIHPDNAASAAVASRAGLVATADMVDDEIVWVSSARP